jgi:CubicO group peptidase (beta-lactamase class C family)
MAFQILGYALEAITGKNISDVLSTEMFSPLGLRDTSLTVPLNATNAIIPFNTTISGWNANAADEGP